MDLNTASAVIRFAENLEVESGRFYTAASRHAGDLTKVLEGFAKENKKHAQAVKRAYYSVISDALETGFSFQGLSSDPYELDSEIRADASPAEILRTAIANENRIQGFYLHAAECSEALMADVPRVFKRIAGSREKRKVHLQELLEASSGG